MPELTLSLFETTLGPNEVHELSDTSETAWPLRGSLSWHDRELAVDEGHLLSGSGRLKSGPQGCALIRFGIGRDRPLNLPGSRRIAEERVEVPSTQNLLRLDKVSFPPGATAWRHTHPGPGFRYLIQGELRLEADDHTRVVNSGDSWFEAANSPVKAVASTRHAETAFIRLMVLPMEFKGRRTINILSKEDRRQERRQTTTTYCDEPLRL